MAHQQMPRQQAASIYSFYRHYTLFVTVRPLYSWSKSHVNQPIFSANINGTIFIFKYVFIHIFYTLPIFFSSSSVLCSVGRSGDICDQWADHVMIISSVRDFFCFQMVVSYVVVGETLPEHPLHLQLYILMIIVIVILSCPFEHSLPYGGSACAVWHHTSWRNN